MKKIFQSTFISLVVVGLVSAGAPAFAQSLSAAASATLNATATHLNSHISADVQVNVEAQRVGKARQDADTEIDRRTAALNAAITRVNAMVKLSADEKAAVSTSLQAQITAMAALRTQVDNDADAGATSSLKADIKSITGDYRIFMLVLPQAAIASAADRVLAVASTMADLSAKLQARITAAQSAGNNVSAALSALASLNTQVANANTAAQAAISETIHLTPDQGNQTQMQANTAALKDARGQIQSAQKFLNTARSNAQNIISAIGSWKATASSTTSAAVQ